MKACHDPYSDRRCLAAANPYAAFWFGIFYTAFYLADTVTNVPYEALGPELSDSYDERSRIYFVHKFFNMLGTKSTTLSVFNWPDFTVVSQQGIRVSNNALCPAVLCVLHRRPTSIGMQ